MQSTLACKVLRAGWVRLNERFGPGQLKINKVDGLVCWLRWKPRVWMYNRYWSTTDAIVASGSAQLCGKLCRETLNTLTIPEDLYFCDSTKDLEGTAVRCL